MRVTRSTKSSPAHIGSRARRLMAVMLAGVVMALTSAAPPASAGHYHYYPEGTLSITRHPYASWSYYVTVSGHMHMSPEQARSLINNSVHEVQFRLWGDDWIDSDGDYDDQLTDWYSPASEWRSDHYWVGDDGLYFSETRLMYGSTLNEDWGQDEVYAQIAFSYPGDIYPYKVKTARVTGYF